MQEIKRYTDDASPTAPAPAANVAAPSRHRWLWQGRLGEAFWKAATLFSLIVNLILVVTLLVVGLLIFRIKNDIVQPLVVGLHGSFVEMDNATIRATIPVSDSLPVEFDLPLNTNTTVTLVQDTPIKSATIFLNGQAVPINIVLPAGTPLGISLNLVVPVRQVVPVRLMVDAVIPLRQTELHSPFDRLRHLFEPYVGLLNSLPNGWQGAVCQTTGQLCPADKR